MNPPTASQQPQGEPKNVAAGTSKHRLSLDAAKGVDHHESFSSFSDFNLDETSTNHLDLYDVGEYHLTSCPICLEYFTLENPAILLKCEHGFHLQCLESWRQHSAVCPVCLKTVRGDEGRLMRTKDVRRRRRIERKTLVAVAASSEKDGMTTGIMTGSPFEQVFLRENCDERQMLRPDLENDDDEADSMGDLHAGVWSWLTYWCSMQWMP